MCMHIQCVCACCRISCRSSLVNQPLLPRVDRLQYMTAGRRGWFTRLLQVYYSTRIVVYHLFSTSLPLPLDPKRNLNGVHWLQQSPSKMLASQARPHPSRCNRRSRLLGPVNHSCSECVTIPCWLVVVNGVYTPRSTSIQRSNTLPIF